MNEWKEVRLIDISSQERNSFIDGDWIETPFLSELGIRLIQTGNIGRGIFRDNNKKYISEESFVSLKCKEVKTGDILICRLADPIGRSCKVPSLPTKNITSVDVTIFRVDSSKYSEDYILQLINTDDFLIKANEVAGGSTRQRISRSKLGNLKVLVPESIEKQKEIARILTTCDTVIEQTQSAIAKYKAIKQGLLHDLFTRGLDASGHLRPSYQDAPEFYKESELGMIPKEWEVKRLEEIGDVVTGSTPSTLNPQNYADKYQFISPADIIGQQYILKSDKMLSDIGFSASRRIPVNSICVVCIGSTIGKSAMTSVECCTNQQINTIVPFENIIALFNYYATKQYLTKQFAANMGLQAVPIVNKSTFQKFIIPIPNDRIEAILIQDKLITIDNKIYTEETLLQKYQSIKRGLMGDLLGGKKEVV